MAQQLLPILALLFSTAFLLAGNGMHSILLPLRGTAEGFSTASLGLIGTGWAVGFVLGCLAAPVVVRRVGHIRAFACSAASAAVIILLNGLVVMPLAWILLRAFSGFFLAGAFMVIESWLNERASNENRGAIFATYMTVTYLAITGGQLGVALGDTRTGALFMCGAILFCVAVLPTALSTAASPRPLARVSIDLRGLFAHSPVAFATVMLVGVINGAFGTLAAVWGSRIGLSTPTIALMMSLTVVAGALTQVPVGRISDRTDRRYVISVAAIGAALTGLAILLLHPATPQLALPLAALYGALTYPIYGLAVAQANDFADPGEFVAVSGGLLLLYGIGTAVGPLAGSAAMGALGAEALFVVTASSHALIATYALYRTFKRAPVPEKVRDAHMPVPGHTSTPQTASLDPRAEEVETADREALVAVK